MKYLLPFNLDDPRATIFQKDIVKSKPFLKKVYEEWYAVFNKSWPTLPAGKLLELGSCEGFLNEIIPHILTCDNLDLPLVVMKIDAQKLLFEDKSLAAVFMINVFRHIPGPGLFLEEASRTLNLKGKIIMIEQANSILRRFIYKNFHHEPFDPAGGRKIVSSKPMTVSNQALPYIYFERDSKLLQTNWSYLKTNSIQYLSPFKYTFNGGISRSSLIPFWTYPFFTLLEWVYTPFRKIVGLFVTIERGKELNK